MPSMLGLNDELEMNGDELEMNNKLESVDNPQDFLLRRL